MSVISWMVRLAVIAAVFSACTPDVQPAQREQPNGSATDTLIVDSLHLVDLSIPSAVAGEDGWNFHQSAAADFNGDGLDERIVLAARVEMYRGRPAWDDGQPWQVYVEEQGGTRTRVYAQRLQLGTLTMRITRGELNRAPTIILLEHLPDRLRIYEVTYRGPGRVSLVERFQRDLDPSGETASPKLP